MAPIPHLSYVVFKNESHWTVGFADGECSGRFPSRRDAIRSALFDAARVRRLGYDIDVWVRRGNGTLRRLSDRSAIVGTPSKPS